LTLAKEDDVILEIVFDNDIENRSSGAPLLALVWQGVMNLETWDFRGWTPEGVENTVYGFTEDGIPRHAEGVSYDKASKKLSIPLSTALETYDEFLDVLLDASLLLACWWGADRIGELGIVSASLIQNK
jgi:hypothetical protein